MANEVTKGILQAVAILSLVAVGMSLVLYCIGSWIGSLIKPHDKPHERRNQDSET
jgi:hypothetical protein